YKIFSTDDSYTDHDSLVSYLQVPEGIGPVRSLAKEITSGIRTAPEKASAIKQYLLKNYRYSLKTDQPQGSTTVIEHFLFTSLRGYCEHFATAMVLMLRSVGMPARLVTGFSSSQKNDLGDYYILRQSDAHSWVEAFIDGRWILYDPTPPSFAARKNILFLIIDLLRLNWDRYVVGFSSDDQKAMVRYITGPGKRQNSLLPDGWRGAAGVFAFLMTALIIFRFLRRKKSTRRLGRVSVPYVQLRKKISASGGHITPSSTASDVLRQSRGISTFNQARIERFLKAYQRLRFSGLESEVLLRDFERLGKQLEN
ncbi:MAG: transglutaminase-like domain-containing protein, partial [bacterium]